jgi:hypothetical protein
LHKSSKSINTLSHRWNAHLWFQDDLDTDLSLNDNSGYDIHKLFDDDQICTNSGKKDDGRKTRAPICDFNWEICSGVYWSLATLAGLLEMLDLAPFLL